MREKQHRDKWRTIIREAGAVAREDALNELRDAEARNIRMNVQQTALFEKGRQALGEGVETPAAQSPRELKAALRSVREATLFDPAQPLDVRRETLGIGKLPIGESRPLTLRILRLIGDAKQPEDLRVTALDAFLTATFALRTTADWRPEFLETLRRIAQNETGEVSVRALAALAAEGDGWALETLQEGLRDRTKARVPTAQALQYFTADDHGDHFDVLREIARKNGKATVRADAVRSLSADPASHDLVRELLTNPKHPVAVRQAALVALRTLDPEAFRAEAARIAEDGGEKADLRAVALTALRLDSPRTERPLAPMARQLQVEATGGLKRAAQLYLPPEE